MLIICFLFSTVKVFCNFNSIYIVSDFNKTKSGFIVNLICIVDFIMFVNLYFFVKFVLY